MVVISAIDSQITTVGVHEIREGAHKVNEQHGEAPVRPLGLPQLQFQAATRARAATDL